MEIINSVKAPLHGVFVSMQGGRAENQDDCGYVDTPIGFLFVVCDGMGGGPGGKTASYIAKYEIAQILCQCNGQVPKDYALKMAAARAHQALENKMKEIPSLAGMGSTFVAVLIDKHSAFVAHAGDSRCYQIRGNKVVYRSNDHSLVAELVRQKALTEEEARLSPQSNVISRGLGSTNNHVPEIDEVPYRKGDRFVLCTDGVWGSMSQKDLLARLSAKIELKTLISNLSAEIDHIGFSKGGNHDNHTMAIIDIDANSEIRIPLDWKKVIVICSAVCFVFVLMACLYVLFSRGGADFRHVEDTSVQTPLNPVRQPNMQPASNKDAGKTGENDTISIISAIKTDSLLNDLRQKKNKEEYPEGNPQEQKKNTDTEKNGSKQEKTNVKKNPSSEDVTTSQKEIVQRTIEEYIKAQQVKAKNANDAAQSLGRIRVDINKALEALRTKVRKGDLARRTDTIKKMAEYADGWFIDSVVEKNTKLYRPTRKAQNRMKGQIERLKRLKRDL